MLPFQESLKSANFTTLILQISPTTTDTTVLAGFSTVHLAAIIGGGIAVVVILVILVSSNDADREPRVAQMENMGEPILLRNGAR